MGKIVECAKAVVVLLRRGLHAALGAFFSDDSCHSKSCGRRD